MKRRAIPDRWAVYKPIGEKIHGTRFIAFKVPLKSKLNANLKECERLDADKLLTTVPDLGLIIDLTDTDRYYDPQCFQLRGVEYRKLKIPGKITPPWHLIRKFKQYVQDYLRDNIHNNKLIGVHCTHGVNRTGFFICSYMVTEMTINPCDAIKEFGVARGHPIERQNYLRALQRMQTNRRRQEYSDNFEDNSFHSSRPTRSALRAGDSLSSTRWTGDQRSLSLSEVHILERQQQRNSSSNQRRTSNSRERLMNFEQRWNTNIRHNRTVEHHHRRDNTNTRNRSTTNHIDNYKRGNNDHVSTNEGSNKIDYNARWNYVRPSGTVSNWRDQKHHDHNTQRNLNNSSKYTWNRNFRNNTDN